MSRDLIVQLERLASFDTPTICNALERVDPQTQARGFTVRPLMCGFPELAPIVGFARTATIRAESPPAGSAADVKALRHAYYRYVDTGPKPSIIVMQDLDGQHAGYGAFWGEVHSAVHKGLGAIGLVTDGSVRDIPQWAPGFQFLAGSVGPSHAYANLVAFGGPVEVAGMRVSDGDIVHADRHGAVVIPRHALAGVAAAAAAVTAREARILSVARAPGCTAEKLIDVLKDLDAAH